MKLFDGKEIFKLNKLLKKKSYFKQITYGSLKMISAISRSNDILSPCWDQKTRNVT